MADRLQDTDSVDVVQLFRITVYFGPAFFALLSASWYFMLKKGWISPVVFVLLLLANFPLTIAGIVTIHRTVTLAAKGFAKTVLAGGDIAPPPTYPRQDVLIVRGQYQEAADCFRDHLTIEPGDHEARLRLAQLLETHLQGYDEAERLYLEIRRAQPPAEPRHEMQAANGLIDLYRKRGKRERLMIELARFVERYRGTKFAEGAARELKELKQANLTSESPRSPT